LAAPFTVHAFHVEEAGMGLEVVGGVVLGLAVAAYLIIRFSKKNR
jgi:hypothetical protein